MPENSSYCTSSTLSYPHYYSVGIHSVVIYFLWPACTIVVVFSPLYFWSSIMVCSHRICANIASVFTLYYFRANMRASMYCFNGTNISHIIATYFWIIYICYTLCLISPMDLHNFYILISLQQQCNVFSDQPYPKNMSKTLHVVLVLKLTTLSLPDSILGVQTFLRIWVW